MYFSTITGSVNLALNAVTIVIILVVAFYAGRSKVRNANYSDLIERVGLLEKERDEARQQHIENQKAIANLEGQLKTYKEIPLQRIDKSLALLAKSNDMILTTLQAANLDNSKKITTHTEKTIETVKEK